jgi:hypothetical protein
VAKGQYYWFVGFHFVCLFASDLVGWNESLLVVEFLPSFAEPHLLD